MRQNQGLVKGAILCFGNPYFYFQHGESIPTAIQKSKDLNKVSLLLQDLGQNVYVDHTQRETFFLIVGYVACSKCMNAYWISLYFDYGLALLI